MESPGSHRGQQSRLSGKVDIATWAPIKYGIHNFASVKNGQSMDHSITLASKWLFDQRFLAKVGSVSVRNEVRLQGFRTVV